MNLLRYYMNEIETHTQTLTELVRQYVITDQAVVCSLPRISKEEEQQIIDDDYDVIPVSTLTGEDAVETGIEAFRDMYVFNNELSRRFVQKYPGILPLACPAGTIEPTLSALNTAKQAFKQEVQKFDGPDEKFFEVHDRFNYLITTMAYRKIYHFNGDYKAFYFNWSRRPRVESDTRQNWLDKLERARATIPANHTRESWYALLDADIQKVSEVMQPKLSVRRPIKLRPECSVRDKENKMLGYSAGLPFILTGFTDKPRVTTLKDYVRKPPQTHTANWQLVVPRMHLYQKLK